MNKADSLSTSLRGKVVTVLGGSGFFGRHLAQELLARGARLRIASRNPQRAFSLKPLANLGQVQFLACDVTRANTLGPALANADAVINLCGAFTGDLDALQGDGAGRIATAAREVGARDFVHVSAIGADPHSTADYARTKAEGEEAVRAAFPEATIVRPSVLFGSDDGFLMMFAGLISAFPMLPVFAPDARLQPLLVDDAAEALASIVVNPQLRGKIYEIGGPEVLTMLELNRRIAEEQGRKRTFIELPDAVSKVIAAIPGTPISSDQLQLLKEGNIVSGRYPGLAELGVKPRPMGLFLPDWMTRFRKHGRFGSPRQA